MTQPIQQQPGTGIDIPEPRVRLKGSVAVSEKIFLDIPKLADSLNHLGGNFRVELTPGQKRDFFETFLQTFRLKPEIVERIVEDSAEDKPQKRQRYGKVITPQAPKALTLSAPITPGSFIADCNIPSTLRALAIQLAENLHELCLKKRYSFAVDEEMLRYKDEAMRSVAAYLTPEPVTQRLSLQQQQQQQQ